MQGAMSLPVWSIALVLAAGAPFGAKALAVLFERRSRERSQRLLVARTVSARDKLA